MHASWDAGLGGADHTPRARAADDAPRAALTPRGRRQDGGRGLRIISEPHIALTRSLLPDFQLEGGRRKHYVCILEVLQNVALPDYFPDGFLFQ